MTFQAWKIPFINSMTFQNSWDWEPITLHRSSWTNRVWSSRRPCEAVHSRSSRHLVRDHPAAPPRESCPTPSGRRPRSVPDLRRPLPSRQTPMPLSLDSAPRRGGLVGRDRTLPAARSVDSMYNVDDTVSSRQLESVSKSTARRRRFLIDSKVCWEEAHSFDGALSR